MSACFLLALSAAAAPAAPDLNSFNTPDVRKSAIAQTLHGLFSYPSPPPPAYEGFSLNFPFFGEDTSPPSPPPPTLFNRIKQLQMPKVSTSELQKLELPDAALRFLHRSPPSAPPPDDSFYFFQLSEPAAREKALPFNAAATSTELPSASSVPAGRMGLEMESAARGNGSMHLLINGSTLVQVGLVCVALAGIVVAGVKRVRTKALSQMQVAADLV